MILQYQRGSIVLGQRTLVMGILNVTPDSFSESRINESEGEAIERGLKLIDDGADILDIGGESTRPDSKTISAEEEIRRVLPVLRGIRARTEIPISIDTYKAQVAQCALESGADIINDISGFCRDKQMKQVASQYRSGCIVMHMRGTPQTMQKHTKYDQIIEEIIDYFQRTITMLTRAGIAQECMCIDPGIGFSKTTEQNLYLLKNLSAFQVLERPLLVGPSRKSFIGKILNIAPPGEREWGTSSTVTYSIIHGVHIIRVHNVKAMKQVCTMTDAICRS